jgi:hypothetical protein
MKGFNQYQKFKNGGSLTPKQAILAQCFVCNGENEGGEDCLGISCPLYEYMPYRKGRQKKVRKDLSTEQRAIVLERLKKGREHRVYASNSNVLQ